MKRNHLVSSIGILFFTAFCSLKVFAGSCDILISALIDKCNSSGSCRVFVPPSLSEEQCAAQISSLKEAVVAYKNQPDVEEVIVTGFGLPKPDRPDPRDIKMSLSWLIDSSSELPKLLLQDGSGSKPSTPKSKNPASQNKVDCGTPKKVTGQPVIIATGEKVFADTDLALEGEFGLMMQRSYITLNSTSGAYFGRDWVTNFDKRLQFNFNAGGFCTYGLDWTIYSKCSLPQDSATLSDITYAHGRNAQSKFLWDAVQQKWLTVDGLQLTRDANNNWVLTESEGTVEVFDNVGRLVSISNVNGLIWQLSYNPTDNRPQRVTHSSGRTFTFTWHPTVGSVIGKLKSVTDSFNRTVSYTYGTSGYAIDRLETITYPNGDVKKYTYNSLPFISGFSINGVTHTEYTYSAGKVASSGKINGVEKSTFTYTSNSTVVTNALGGKTTYVYDSSDFKRLSSIGRDATGNCPAGTSLSEYVSSTSPNLLYTEDWQGNRTTYAYNDKQQISKDFFNGKT